MTPDPLTIASIELQVVHCDKASGDLYYECGCDLIIRTQNGAGSPYLCQYHQGYDDGVASARREADEMLRRKQNNYYIGPVRFTNKENTDD